jgi:hypothetical protein
LVGWEFEATEVKPGLTRNDVEVVILQRVRQRFEWQVRISGVVLAKGFSCSVAQARLDGEVAIPRAIRDELKGRGRLRA